MKLTIVFVTLFAITLAAPRPEDAIVLKSESEVGPESFKYAYETSDGVKAEARGLLKNIGSENESLAVQGAYTYVNADGQTISVEYIADENGFQPKGDHLPVATSA
ncbi:larval cuticle protein 65Ag1-like [Lucilia cuprina]|uniref:larval cuticle protein 65Ag1-like n=1 Tax=Lucilia cuprina TaxID=7375 RepID=UPI001F0640E8|nr:larval cuticle protein 65Ag1-like [Lucilia cuprina]XP_046806850.1 larval cuticle protein 65Ag1-like [Lucilia cuprina]